MILNSLKIQLVGIKSGKRTATYLLAYSNTGMPIAFKKSVIGNYDYMNLPNNLAQDLHYTYHNYWTQGKVRETMIYFDGVTPKTKKYRYLKFDKVSTGAINVVEQTTIFTDDCGAAVVVHKLLEEAYVSYI